MSHLNKVVKTGIEARNKIVKGANFVADAVKSTLGPFGMNAAIEKGGRITNDGVSIAREISLKDELEDRGVAIIREAAVKSNDEAGDGTTSAMTLAQAILKEALKYLPNEKTVIGKKRPIEIVNQLHKEKDEVIEMLKGMSEIVTSKEQLIQSAKVSVEDNELAEIIGSTQWDLGKDGYIICEETSEKKCSVQRISGVRIDNGFASSLVQNNQEKQSLEIENVHVILTSHTVTRPEKQLLPIVQQLANAGKNKLAIIARAFSKEAISFCMENMRAGFEIYPINAPYTDHIEIFKDLQAVLNARYINDEDGELEDMNLSDVGFARHIISRRFDSIFTGEDNEVIRTRTENRLVDLRKRLEGEVSEFEKKNLTQRIAQLSNGLAILKVGARSDVERKYRKDKADDAVNAVRAVLEEGTVPGAGLAFKTISDKLPDTYLLKTPLLSIYNQIKSTAPQDFVIEDWVKDPVKVLRIALSNAVSVAGTLSTINIAIAQERPKPRLVEEVKTKEEEIEE